MIMHYLISKLKQMLPLCLGMLFMFPAMAFAAPEGPPEGASLHFSTTNTTTNQSPRFEPNRGQVADPEGNLLPHIKYVYRAPGMTMGLTKNGFIYNVYTVENQEKEPAEELGLTAAIEPANPRHEEPQEVTYHYHRVEVEFVGANPNPQLIAEEQTEDFANYYLGHCPQGITGVYGYQQITYQNLYPNIDLVLKLKKDAQGQDQLKYDIIVHPGGNLSQVKMAYHGMDSLSLEDGLLQVSTSQGSLIETIPTSYWKESGAAEEVNYHLAEGVVSFTGGEQQESKTLVVDPSLSWSTYLGGGAVDYGFGVATDSHGNAIGTGLSMGRGFPTTQGAFKDSLSAGHDAFITKFARDGSILWSTFLGGSDPEWGMDVTTDGQDNIFVTGWTTSSDFPTTSGAFQPSALGRDAYLCKFSSSGSLTWSTYFGGSHSEWVHGLATSADGSVFMTGETYSNDLPTNGAHQPAYQGEGDAFLACFTSGGNLSWSTYIGGSRWERGLAVATDGDGSAYVTGETESPGEVRSAGFPITSGVLQPAHGGGEKDGFLMRFSLDGSLVWSTFLGGGQPDGGWGVCTDLLGNIYVTGHTWSTDFHRTNGSFQSTLGGRADAFLIKLTSDCRLIWSTFLGSGGVEGGDQVDIDINGNPSVVGYVEDTRFPVSNGAFQSSYSGDSDAFLTKFKSNGNMLYSTYLGGTEADYGTDVANGNDGETFMIGHTGSYDFPVKGAIQPANHGAVNAFVAKFTLPTPTGIMPLPPKLDVMLYPNPSSGKGVITFKVPAADSYELALINNLGQQVFRKSVTIHAGRQSLQVSLKDYPAGIYHLTLQNGDHQVVKKWIIQ